MHHDHNTRLNALNHQFYTKYAASFDVSRRSAWEGWLQLLPHLQAVFAECKSVNETPAILDIGCGNGRFLAFLLQHFEQESCDYTGIDLSSQLLEKAAAVSIPTAFSRTLMQIDVVAELEKISQPQSKAVALAKIKAVLESRVQSKTQLPSIFSRSFHLTVILGVLHHIPSYEYRKLLLEEALQKTTKNGLVIVTFWQFAHSARFQDKAIPATPPTTHAALHRSTDSFEDTDFLLPWQGTPQARYAHHFSQTEIDQLKSELPPHTVVATFVADGREQLNAYVILKKTE